MRLSSTKLVPLVLITISMCSLVWGNSDGPPPGFTGTAFETTCATSGCHDSHALNSGSGMLSISVSPQDYSPGDTVDVRVSLSQTGQQRWGFEAAVDDHIGTFILTDPARTRIVLDSAGNQFVTQTSAGTDSGMVDSANGWSFKWAVPDRYPPDASFFVAAGCTADADGTASGDYVYTTFALATCPVFLTGDVDGTGTITARDLFAMVAYIFKGSYLFFPCAAAGDVDCNGSVTSSDLIYLVNYVFKGGPPPCDVCNLIPDVWTCP